MLSPTKIKFLKSKYFHPKSFTRQTFAKQNLVGFTLLELLVVIAILGILLSVGFVFYQRALQNARDQTRISDLSNIKIALEQYFADDNFAYPISEVGGGKINDAVCSPSSPTWGTDSFTCGGFTYMKVLPRDPSRTVEYCYEAIGTPPNEFFLHAKVENTNNTHGTPRTCNGVPYDYILESEK